MGVKPLGLGMAQVVICGPPGSGKTTQCLLLAERAGMVPLNARQVAPFNALFALATSLRRLFVCAMRASTCVRSWLYTELAELRGATCVRSWLYTELAELRGARSSTPTDVQVFPPLAP